MCGKVSSLVRWVEPPTSKTDRSGKVKGTRGNGLGVKKGLKLENCKRRPVQPVSAMRGNEETELRT